MNANQSPEMAVDTMKLELKTHIRSIQSLRGLDSTVIILEREVHELVQRLVQSKIQLAQS
jgi:hypothetical protein